MKINDIYEIEIIDDNHNGMGFSKINNMPIFIRHTLKGDIVKIKITEINKKYMKGEVLSFINKEKREKVTCPYYGECGGCDLLHIPYEKEIKLKKDYLEKLFSGFNIKITSLSRTNYRNKIVLHVKDNQLGLYKENSNDLIPINKCLLVDEKINNLIDKLNSLNLSKVDEVTIRQGIEGALISIEGNLNEKDLKKLENSTETVSIYQNDKLIYGKKCITEKINNIKYVINNKSFFQVNNDCCEQLYDKIKTYIEKDKKVLDLYCGAGTIGIYCNDICKSITGVEINKDSVLCCKENLKINNVKNYNIINADAKAIKENFDIVIVDPPRSGLSKKVIENLNKINAKKIIYVSCNPSTLKRDIKLLTKYSIKEITAFNMFPCTKHCESLVVLERIVK